MQAMTSHCRLQLTIAGRRAAPPFWNSVVIVAPLLLPARLDQWARRVAAAAAAAPPPQLPCFTGPLHTWILARKVSCDIRKWHENGSLSDVFLRETRLKNVSNVGSTNSHSWGENELSSPSVGYYRHVIAITNETPNVWKITAKNWTCTLSILSCNTCLYASPRRQNTQLNQSLWIRV